MKRFLILLFIAATLIVSCASTSSVEGEVKEKNFTAYQVYQKSPSIYVKGSSYLRERFNYYNETLFNNELKVDHIGYMMHDEVSDCSGFYSWGKDKNTDICIIINYDISNAYGPYTDEQLYDSVLLHEMTHAWRYQVMESIPLEKENDGHDSLFRKKIYELRSATKLPINF